MHHHANAAIPAPAAKGGPAAPRNEWRALRLLLPYLWEFRTRVVIALVFLVGAKLPTSACRSS